MFARLLTHLRHNAVGYVALFFALSGAAIAAKPLVTGEGIQDGSLTGADVQDNSLGGADILESSLTGFPNADTLDGIDSAGFVQGGGALESGQLVANEFVEPGPGPSPVQVAVPGGTITLSCWDPEFGSHNPALVVHNPDADDPMWVWIETQREIDSEFDAVRLSEDGPDGDETSIGTSFLSAARVIVRGSSDAGSFTLFGFARLVDDETDDCGVVDYELITHET